MTVLIVVPKTGISGEGEWKNDRFDKIFKSGHF